MVVDCHVHTRDFNEKHKETIGRALYHAQRAGVAGIFAMPNTDPPLITEDRVLDYLALAERADTKGVFFGAYMALTKDVEQIKQAISTHRTLRPHVVGFKLYAGHSTNNIGVVEEQDQRVVFRTLASEGYEGVLFVHAEKQALVHDELFDRTLPITHAQLARPPAAEIASITDMLRFSREEGFKGKLHIAHISTPESVALVSAARAAGYDVSCGVTPHHLCYNQERMNAPDGRLYKINPPLRQKGTERSMLALLEQGDIQWIETDHAPHLFDEKQGDACPSGIPSLHAWPLFVEFLQQEGFTGRRIQRITHDAIVDRFGIDIPLSTRATVYDRNAYQVRVWDALEVRLAGKK